ncbi:MAG: hypothetical protein C0602_11625 [Denitrovibrio sp.]|nr:MAG: hypothetical protein C0602_11625 [Denitrovibrio sp.]
MKKIILIISLILSITVFANAGEKSEKAGEVVGEAAKDTKEATILIIDATKKGAKKTGKFLKEVFEDTKESASDFKDGVKEGYKKED